MNQTELSYLVVELRRASAQEGASSTAAETIQLLANALSNFLFSYYPSSPTATMHPGEFFGETSFPSASPKDDYQETK